MTKSARDDTSITGRSGNARRTAPADRGALANAGVDLRGGVLADAASSGRACRVAGLIWGKTFWIELVTLLAHRTRVATLSSGVSTAPVWGVAALAGSGFTVLMFITGLASTTPGSSTMPR